MQFHKIRGFGASSEPQNRQGHKNNAPPCACFLAHHNYRDSFSWESLSDAFPASGVRGYNVTTCLKAEEARFLSFMARYAYPFFKIADGTFSLWGKSSSTRSYESIACLKSFLP